MKLSLGGQRANITQTKRVKETLTYNKSIFDHIMRLLIVGKCLITHFVKFCPHFPNVSILSNIPILSIFPNFYFYKCPYQSELLPPVLDYRVLSSPSNKLLLFLDHYQTPCRTNLLKTGVILGWATK